MGVYGFRRRLGNGVPDGPRFSGRALSGGPARPAGKVVKFDSRDALELRAPEVRDHVDVDAQGKFSRRALVRNRHARWTTRSISSKRAGAAVPESRFPSSRGRREFSQYAGHDPRRRRGSRGRWRFREPGQRVRLRPRRPVAASHVSDLAGGLVGRSVQRLEGRGTSSRNGRVSRRYPLARRSLRGFRAFRRAARRHLAYRRVGGAASPGRSRRPDGKRSRERRDRRRALGNPSAGRRRDGAFG